MRIDRRLNPTLAYPSSSAALTALLATGLLTSASLPAQSIEACVDLTSLMCIETTAELGSDEPFIAGSWANVQTRATAKIHVPSPSRVYFQGLYFTVYPKFGDVDKGEWVFNSARRVFRGTLANGQTVVVVLKFWEGDSNYTTEDYARDMLPLVQSAAISLASGGSVSWFTIAQGVYYSAKLLFGWGADDFLGSMTVRLTNVNGQLQKTIEATKASWLDGWSTYDYETASLFDTARLNYLRSIGYVVVYTNYSNFQCILRRDVHYGVLSPDRRTIRMILDGDGEGRYHASVVVRQGPFNSTTPDGTAATWVQDTTYTAH